MIVQEYPSCCGLYLLREFGNTNAALNNRAYSTEEINKFLKINSATRAANIAVINSDQYTKLQTVFEDNGWECVKSYYYPAHGNNIYVMMKLNPCNIIKTVENESI